MSSGKSDRFGGLKRTNSIPESYVQRDVAFEVFDDYDRESKGNGQSCDEREINTNSLATKSSVTSVGDKRAQVSSTNEKNTIMGSINAITTRTSALSIGDDYSRGRVESMDCLGFTSASGTTTKSKLPPVPSTDTLALQLMHTRLSDFLNSGVLPETTSSSGDYCELGDATNSVWVTRYVDYTSKYGLGFLLNDGSAGVYFNDSTKAVVAPDGDTFQYIERRKNFSADPRMPEYDVHTLSSFPESLKKKVTLLKHFCGYLSEQQKRSNEDTESLATTGATEKWDNYDLVHLKKWVRTRHAIFFRLSDGTVQVIFFDQTEVLLSSDISKLTYVDKSRDRRYMSLSLNVLKSYPDVTKRLKYTKDILYQLVYGVKS